MPKRKRWANQRASDFSSVYVTPAYCWMATVLARCTTIMRLVHAIHIYVRMACRAALGTRYTLRSIGTPTRLPHSVQEPS
jgi:hypothetical protein